MLANFQKNKVIVGFFFVIFAIVFLMYGNYLKLYFSQDDFFHFRVSTSGRSFLEFFKFSSFSERDGIYFYRPLFREVLFNFYYKLFGLEPLPFRITQFVLHIVNIVLTYLVIFKITKNRAIAIIAAFFFGLVATNVGILSYLAGGITVSGMLTFFLISISSYLKYLDTTKFKYKFISFLFFLGALMSHETAATLPLINILLSFNKNGLNSTNIKTAIFDNLYYFVSVGVLIVLEIFIIGLPVSEMNYGLNLSIMKLLNSYVWYGLWGIGIPEMLLDFVGPGVNLNPNLMKYWGNYFVPIFSALFLLIFLVAISYKQIFKNKLTLVFVCWFLVGLTPVVFLPFHRQYHYLQVVLPAIAGIVGIIFIEMYKKYQKLAILFGLSLVVLNFYSIKLSESTHWSISRSKKAETILSEFRNKYPSLPRGAKIYFKNDMSGPYFNEEWGNSSKQASIILSGSDALQMMYKDKTLKVYYEDLVDTPIENAYEFQVSINK